MNIDHLIDGGMRVDLWVIQQEKIMRHQDIKLSDLNTVERFVGAVEDIERDSRNSEGFDWYSGRETYLKRGAKAKIAAIWKRFDRLFPSEADTH